MHSRAEPRVLTIDGERVTFRRVLDPDRPISVPLGYVPKGPPRLPILVADYGPNGLSGFLLAQDLPRDVGWERFTDDDLVRLFRDARERQRQEPREK